MRKVKTMKVSSQPKRSVFQGSRAITLMTTKSMPTPVKMEVTSSASMDLSRMGTSQRLSVIFLVVRDSLMVQEAMIQSAEEIDI